MVSDYSHEKAVADGVNVGNEIFIIDTKIGKHGARIEAQQTVERREKLTRKKRWEAQDEDEIYSAKQLADYLRQHQDEIAALTIFFRQPQRRRELTFAMIRQLGERLKSDRPKLAPFRVWQAFSHLDDYKGKHPLSELAALVALVRRVCDFDQTLANYDDTVRRNFQGWIMKHHSGGGLKFNDEQMEWLRMIRDHVAGSFHFERDDLEMAPFDGQGGLGKMCQIFGAGMDSLIEELNEALAA